jgi:hypothetical protein
MQSEGQAMPRVEGERRAARATYGAVALLALALGGWTLAAQRGWFFADAVEYLERARAFVQGDALIDAQGFRPISVSLLYMPLFALAEWTGRPDAMWIAPVARVVAVLVAAAAAVATAALGRRVAGRMGLAAALAGVVVASNPVLLRYGALPLADVAAALCVTLGLLVLAPLPTGLHPGHVSLAHAQGPRSAFRLGLAVGAAGALAVLTAYKTLPLVAVLGAAAAIRAWLGGGARAAGGAAVGLGLALSVAIAVQCTLDVRMYGGFGRGLLSYIAANVGPQAGTYLYELGFTELGARLYQWGHGSIALEGVSRAVADIQGFRPRTWYLTHLNELLPEPLVPFLVLGAVIALVRPSGRVPLLLVLVHVLATSRKGDKDFRLWLPVLPALAVFVGLGAELIAGGARAAWARARGSLVLTAALLALGMTAVRHAAFLRTDAVRFAAYVDAAHWAEAHLPRGARPLALASAWNWAVLLQTGPRVALTKLPKQVDQWRSPGVDDTQRAAVLAALEEQDAVILHHAVLTSHVDLCAWLAERFGVAAAYWDVDLAPGLGPVLVLVRDAAVASGAVAAVPTWRLVALGVPPDDDPRRHAPGLVLARSDLERPERLALLGAEAVRLPGGGVGWLQTTWRADGGAIAGGPEGMRTGGYQMRTRLADPLGRWHVDTWRPFGRGIAPSGSWPPGSVLVDGWVLDPARGPLEGPAGPRALAGHRDAELWLDVATRDGARVTGRLHVPADAEHAPNGDCMAGWHVGADGAFRAASFVLPDAPGVVRALELVP